MNTPSCRVQTLANGGLSKIDYCLDCQLFHLQIGYTTLHLKPEAFATLSGTLNTALACFRRQHSATKGERLQSAAEIENSVH